MEALKLLGATRSTPLDLQCVYRFQSARSAEAGGLYGTIVQEGAILSAREVNKHIRLHARWLGKCQISLKPVVVTRRTGVFERHSDALYYFENFSFTDTAPFDHDLLDVTKLEALFADRWQCIEAVFTTEAFEWLRSAIGEVTVTAVNEYMCHEGGHAVGFPVAEKYATGFFRLGGRLRWPLVYMEEYRADANSWSIAAGLLHPRKAAAVVLYTLAHRLGLAAQNLKEGRPGAGYVPFLHFAALVDAGVLQLRHHAGGMRMTFSTLDAEAFLEGALVASAAVDKKINASELSQDHEACAEASLTFAATELQRDGLAKTFRQLLIQ
jgi:hypothetical protein